MLSLENLTDMSKELTPQSIVYEVMTKESIRREQVFTGDQVHAEDQDVGRDGFHEML